MAKPRIHIIIMIDTDFSKGVPAKVLTSWGEFVKPDIRYEFTKIGKDQLSWVAEGIREVLNKLEN